MVKLNQQARSSTQQVYTFSMNASPAQVQLLSNHTLDDLIYTCFEKCNPVPGETADEHLWFVTIDGIDYESGDFECRSELRAAQTRLKDLPLLRNKKIDLEYDYGSTSRHTIVVNSIETLPNDVNVSDFPREKPIPESNVTATFTTDRVDLDTAFFDFDRKWFSAASHPEINLFQVGRRKNHGFLQKSGCRMIFMPDKAESLEHYLQCLNHASRVKSSGMYDWHSIVVLTKDPKTSKYTNDIEPGFCDCMIAPASDAPKLDLESIFPNVCALGGFGKKKKGTTKKGWIRYRDNVVMICSGLGSPNSCPQAPKGTAYDGLGCHVPIGDEEVLARKSIQVSSLQELFCTVEGMLMLL